VDCLLVGGPEGGSGAVDLGGVVVGGLGGEIERDVLCFAGGGEAVCVARIGRRGDTGPDMTWTEGGLEGRILDLVWVHGGVVEGGRVEVVVARERGGGGGVGSGMEGEKVKSGHGKRRKEKRTVGVPRR
jgi:hypothetical protein